MVGTYGVIFGEVVDVFVGILVRRVLVYKGLGDAEICGFVGGEDVDGCPLGLHMGPLLEGFIQVVACFEEFGGGEMREFDEHLFHVMWNCKYDLSCFMTKLVGRDVMDCF